ncbi:MAG: hypothetical protein JKY44_08210 [Flavobacteriaceae bacterium]|nr:hypothetical protein [Flavobacteriaceae bacterium]
MLKKQTYLYLFCLIGLSFISTGQNAIEKGKSIQLISSKIHFEAGSKIVLRFSSLEKKNPVLYCSNNYGSTLIKSNTTSSKILSYNIPVHISNKSGTINWRLSGTGSSISGHLKIAPKTTVYSMETYLGPPSIEAGGRDFTMLVVIPTDSLDNPLKHETPVLVKHQFLENEISTEIKTDQLIAYKNIFSPNTSGRMIISSESFGKNSKEYDVNIVPAIPTNFTITAKRNHKYADGNQITSFITSIIKDSLGNIVSDGTYVSFFIRNKKQAILKTFGTTVLGIATAKMIHPDKEAHWTVKAYVEGISESNLITIKYAQVITDFEVKFSTNNRTIKVGPLTSFMNQMIPDGLQVTLTLLKDKRKIGVITKTSKAGFVKFKLKTGIYKRGVYTFQIRVAGITKNIQSKNIW